MAPRQAPRWRRSQLRARYVNLRPPAELRRKQGEPPPRPLTCPSTSARLEPPEPPEPPEPENLVSSEPTVTASALARALREAGIPARASGRHRVILDPPGSPDDARLTLVRRNYRPEDPDPFSGWAFRARISGLRGEQATERRRLAWFVMWKALHRAGFVSQEPPESAEGVALPSDSE